MYRFHLWWHEQDGNVGLSEQLCRNTSQEEAFLRPMAVRAESNDAGLECGGRTQQAGPSVAGEHFRVHRNSRDALKTHAEITQVCCCYLRLIGEACWPVDGISAGGAGLKPLRRDRHHTHEHEGTVKALGYLYGKR